MDAMPPLPPVPVLAAPWIRIAAPPELERWAKPGVQPVDFTIFPAADGVWQLIACVRGTAQPGGNRLLYRWESPSLTAADWRPMGIFAEADPAFGHQPGLLQAPFCVIAGGQWHLFCNSAGAHCLTSRDGRTFSWAANAAGSRTFFPMGRDVMILDHRDRDGLWYAFYTEYRPELDARRKHHTVSYRTARTLDGAWSERVDYGVLTPLPPVGDGYPFCEAESPFVLRRGDWYYRWEQMDVFISRSLIDWSAASRHELVPGGRRSFLAPEIISDGDARIIAAYSYEPGYSGIYLAPLAWREQP
jgi:hypothetical protein